MSVNATFTSGRIIKRLDSVKISAKGNIFADVMVSFDLNASTYKYTSIRLLERTMSFLYTIGGLPVYQDVTLELWATLEFNTNANFNTTLKLSAKKQLEFSFDYQRNRKNKFDGQYTSNFIPDARINLTVNGQAYGQLKIYPVISTNLYRAAKTSLEIVPSIRYETDFNGSFTASSHDWKLTNVTGNPNLTIKALLDAEVDARLEIFSFGIGKKWTKQIMDHEFLALP